MERSGPERFRGKTVATRSEFAFHPEEQRREAKVDRPLPWHAVAFGEGGEDDTNTAAAKPLTILPRIPKGTLAAEPAAASSGRHKSLRTECAIIIKRATWQPVRMCNEGTGSL
jgi:hypothetical protein